MINIKNKNLALVFVICSFLSAIIIYYTRIQYYILDSENEDYSHTGESKKKTKRHLGKKEDSSEEDRVKRIDELPPELAKLNESYRKQAEEFANEGNFDELNRIFEEWSKEVFFKHKIYGKCFNEFRSLDQPLRWKAMTNHFMICRSDGKTPPEIMELVLKLKNATHELDAYQIAYAIRKTIKERDEKLMYCEECERVEKAWKQAIEMGLDNSPVTHSDIYHYEREVYKREKFTKRLGEEAISVLIDVLRGDSPEFLKDIALDLLKEYAKNPKPLIDPVIDLLNSDYGKDPRREEFTKRYHLVKFLDSLIGGHFGESDYYRGDIEYIIREARLYYKVDIRNPEDLEMVLKRVNLSDFQPLREAIQGYVTKEQYFRIVDLFLREEDKQVREILFRMIPVKLLSKDDLKRIIRNAIEDKGNPNLRIAALKYVESITSDSAGLLMNIASDEKENIVVRVRSATLLLTKFGTQYINDVMNAYEMLRGNEEFAKSHLGSEFVHSITEIMLAYHHYNDPKYLQSRTEEMIERDKKFNILDVNPEAITEEGINQAIKFLEIISGVDPDVETREMAKERKEELTKWISGRK